jgi:hypothetical protein
LTSRANRYLDYCISVADEFQARINRLRVFVSHNVSSGTANESILREFLSLHAPSEVQVAQGFIFDPFEEDEPSKQCDILVYDQMRFPLAYADGPIKVVFPDAARMVIEVKTMLDGKALAQAIENIVSADNLSGQMDRFYGVIFAFKSPRSWKTVIDNMRKYQTVTCAPTAILLLDKGIIIHSYGWLREKEMMSQPAKTPSVWYPYAVRRSKDSRKGAIVVAFLLLLFFQSAGGGLFESIPINAIIDAMEEHTELLDDQVYIGAPITLDDG